MAVGGKHALQRQAQQAVGKDLFPGGPGGVAGHAAIDHAPAGRTLVTVAVLQQPQIDMIQRERQRHAQPAQAGRDVNHAAAVRHLVTQRIVQLGFERIHIFIFQVHISSRRATMRLTLT